MLNTETINELRMPQAQNKLQEDIRQAGLDAVAVPAGLKIQDLETWRSGRRRMTGAMETGCMDSLQSYVESFPGEGARAFINAELMTAVCIINFGTAAAAGHADHAAVLKMRQTAEYSALLRLAKERKGQRAMAEFFEDYAAFVTFTDGEGDEIPAAKAVKAIRTLKIKSKQDVGSSVGNYSREKSLLESTEVDTTEGMPHFAMFSCVPYTGLDERTFQLRIGIGEAPGGEPAFVASIIRHDLAVQAMAEELADKLRAKLVDIPVLLGQFNL